MGHHFVKGNEILFQIVIDINLMEMIKIKLPFGGFSVVRDSL